MLVASGAAHVTAQVVGPEMGFSPLVLASNARESLGRRQASFVSEDVGGCPDVRLKHTVFKPPFLAVPFGYFALNWRRADLLDNAAVSASCWSRMRVPRGEAGKWPEAAGVRVATNANCLAFAPIWPAKR